MKKGIWKIRYINFTHKFCLSECTINKNIWTYWINQSSNQHNSRAIELLLDSDWSHTLCHCNFLSKNWSFLLCFQLSVMFSKLPSFLLLYQFSSTFWSFIFLMLKKRMVFAFDLSNFFCNQFLDKIVVWKWSINVGIIVFLYSFILIFNGFLKEFLDHVSFPMVRIFVVIMSPNLRKLINTMLSPL